MPFRISPSNNHVSAVLSGEIYAEEAAAFQATILKQCTSSSTFVHVDATNLAYIDSSGLGALVSIYKKAAELGGRVKISGLRGDVKELFDLTNLNRVFDISD